jgi:site-specific DNA-cytosine methylase
MKKEWQDTISGYLGIEPIEINSSLLSAQSRKRLYWTNIPGIKQPEDKGILLKDIIESGEALRDKSYCIDANYYKGGTRKNHGTKEFQKLRESERRCIVKECIQIGMATDINGHDIIKRVYSVDGKSPTLTSAQGGNQEVKIAVSEEKYRKLLPLECERLQTVPEGYTEGVSSSQRYRMLGNGWTVDVIAHIFSYLPNDYKLNFINIPSCNFVNSIV